MKDYEKIIKFMGGTLERHPLAPKSSQSNYFDWKFRNGEYQPVASWAAEKRMKFEEDWNLLMPVVNKLNGVVEPFTPEYAYLITLKKNLMEVKIKEVYAYALHIINLLEKCQH
jgi:hypothetical protein